MITEITTPNLRQCKLIDEEGITQSSAPFKTFKSKRVDIDTAEEFNSYLNSLSHNQTIAYGLFKNSSGPRSLSNVEGIHNPWIAFDGDYVIHNPDLLNTKAKAEAKTKTDAVWLSLKTLHTLDPQLANCRYVQRNSSSNIIVSGTEVAPHKKKIWMQFSTTNQSEITTYIETLFVRAITLNYGEYLISKSPRSFAKYLRTIFDTAVFSPERIWNEAAPIIKATHVTHNTSSTYKEGYMVDPTALHPLTDQEKSVYEQIKQILASNVAKAQGDKAQEVKANYPKLYKQQTEATLHVLTSYLTSSTDNEVRTSDVINDYLNNITNEEAFRDPLDPDYGSNKAKLFYNDDSIYLHSFAHGSQSYRLLVPIIDMFTLEITDKIAPLPAKGKKLSRKERFSSIAIIKKVAPYLYINEQADFDVIVDELAHVGTKPTIRQLFSTSHTKKDITLSINGIMDQYSMFSRKDAPWVHFDKDEGLVFITRDGMKAIMDNKIPNSTGLEVTAAHQASKDRKDVDGWGMYIHAPTGKLNLWAGFNAHILPQLVTEQDIAPYLELAALYSDAPSEMDRFLDWRADLVQNPLRKGGRPGFAVKGSKGAGKSFEQELMASFFHSFNVIRVTKMDEIVGKHNAELAYCVLLIAEELNMNHTQVAGAKDSMKALITGSVMRVEPKGIDAVQVPIHIHVMLSTNHAEAVLQDSDDRRWDIYKISDKRLRDKAFFGKLQKWWDSGGKNLVFTYLNQRKYNLQDAMEGKLTKAGKDERLDSLWGHDAWVYMLLSSMKDESIRNSPSGWHTAYSSWFTSTYGDKKEPWAAKKLGLELNKQGIIVKESNSRVLYRDKGRELFEKKFFEGKPHNWGEDVEEEEDDVLQQPNL